MGFEDLESEFGCVLVLSQSDLEDEVCVLKGKSFPMLQNTNQGDCRWACWIGLSGSLERLQEVLVASPLDQCVDQRMREGPIALGEADLVENFLKFALDTDSAQDLRTASAQ